MSCGSRSNWQTADRSSAGIAPLPEAEQRAIVLVYAARTFEWRGSVAVHSWIATKETGASEYTTYHVIGWRLRRGLSVVAAEKGGIPDAKWYGSTPQLIRELIGKEAETAIPKIIAASASYPYANSYQAWPGPNSNTYISHIIRNTPELGVELPPHAIGKDWITSGWPVAITETRTGAQISFWGVLGLSLGLGDGIEANVLGLNFGVDVLRPALKLPFVGRLGFSDAPVWKTDE